MASIIVIFSFLIVPSILGNEITLRYEIEEEQDPGTVIGNVASNSRLDEDFSSAEFQKLTYIIFKEGNAHANKFRIDDKTSQLSTAIKLDREVVCESKLVCELKIDIGVYMKLDSGIDDLRKIVRVTIVLQDINDHVPTFTKDTITLEVPESVLKNHVLYISGANDPDISPNSIKEYSLIPPTGMFSLQVTTNLDGSSNLGLIVNHKLDRETVDLFNLKIVAKDGGNPPKTGSVNIQIKVQDDNDNKPVFSNEPYQISIREDFPVGSTIIKLNAVDPDFGVNSNLTYSLSARTSDKVKKFIEINEVTGEIYAKRSLDYEQEKFLQFLVDVSDRGTPSLSSQTSVRIDIEDVNDNAPQLKVNLPPSSRAISESAQKGAFVAHVSVFDEDSGDNGEITCDIADDRFSLLLFSDFAYIFKILLERPLDYEETHNVTVNVTCKDKGNPPQFNSTSFVFDVADENDNPPLFTQKEYRVAFTENNSIGDKILDVQATDPDSGENAKIIYELMNRSSVVTIDSSSGIIRAKTVFDRELKTWEYNFKVIAKNTGYPVMSSTAEVVVIITDENDHPPLFTSKHFTFGVLENQQPGTYVDRLNATDADNSKNTNMIFSFAADSQVNEFSIDPYTGFIKTTKKLNREEKSHYDFNVVVSDKDKSTFVDTAKVTVNILDDNDHPPVILYPNERNKTVQVPFNKPAGTVILTIKAEDSDSDNNAKLTFSINKGNDKKLFMMNSDTGEIMIAKTLHASDSDTYPMVIGAHDNGGARQKNSYSNLNIIVTGGNSSAIRYGERSNGTENQNMAIVITLIIVTVVLAIAVLITICIIRKIDRDRRKKSTSKLDMEKALEMQKPFDHLNDLKSSDSEDNEIEKLKQKIKRDLSFSVNDSEPNFDSSSFTNVTSFTTFTGKNLTSYSSIEQKMLENPQACSSVLSNNTLSPDGNKKNRHYPDKRREINRLSSDHLRPYRGHWLQDQKHQGMSKISEDLTSEISGSTETSERDSGRGGSEEDIHPHSDSDDTKPVTSPSNGENSFHHDETTPEIVNVSSNSLHSPTDTHYQRNISFSDDSVTANTTVDNQQRLRRNFSESCFMATPQNVTPIPHDRMRSLRRCAVTESALMGTFTDYTHSTLGMAYSIGDIDLTGTIAANESTVITMAPEADQTNNTTSYDHTINAEELCNEIDQLFFNNSQY
ncbi:hypothetical protein SNE40_016079 [Patella caerulea]|uniref:Cadherin domain-containing protein n=1 Tax=Patella caerulea TaxID=87958 RepID=A0AAN8JCH3_PATCE